MSVIITQAARRERVRRALQKPESMVVTSAEELQARINRALNILPNDGDQGRVDRARKDLLGLP